MPSPLFSGSTSVRNPRERLAFVLTLVFAFPLAYAIGFVIHERIGPPEVALFIVIAMLYVTLARGRLIGSSVMIHESQYPRVFSIVKRACTALDLPMPLIFVREDNQVPVVALGFGEPYALVISSHWIEHFEDDELAFAIGRELGHIAAGHTRYLSLLSVNGNENPFIALIFGGWLRSCSMTCDRVGLLVCGSLDAAARSIVIASFHHFGRHVNVKQFAEQGREIAGDGALRLGEWLGGEPYATRRIAAMDTFIQSPLYLTNRAWFDRDIPPEPPKLAMTAHVRVQRSDCAGMWRRGWAFLIDAVVVSALVLAFGDARAADRAPITINTDQAAIHATASPKPGEHVKVYTLLGGVNVSEDGVKVADSVPGGSFLRRLTRYFNSPWGFIAGYLWLLVGFAGQSFGMMIGWFTRRTR
ncbi:MAG TPA: M48 family metallopeptidase [Candidatus Aquilonibacter sp.]